jgi:hypothetical protein
MGLLPMRDGARASSPAEPLFLPEACLKLLLVDLLPLERLPR